MKSRFLDSGGREGGRKNDKTKETNVSNFADSSTALNEGKEDRFGSFPSLSQAFSSPSPTSLAAKIHDLDSQMLEGKLVLVGDGGKSLKPTIEASNIVCIDVVREESIMNDDVGGTSNTANKVIQG